MGTMIERLGVAPEVHRRGDGDQQGGDVLSRQVEYPLQADLRSAAMNAGKFLRVGVTGHFQPGLAQLGAQADQTMGDRAEMNWQRQFDVEQHGSERFVNSFGMLLEQFVDLEPVQDRKSQRANRSNMVAQWHQIQQRIVLLRLGEPVQRLL